MGDEPAERAALFLDRDGVINEEVHHLGQVERLAVLPGVAAAIARVNAAGVPVVVVTNQAGIARGLYDEEAYHAVMDALGERLGAEGARFDAAYFCPHHPEATVARLRLSCPCRKPRPGMLLRASAEMGLDLSRSVLVGDRETDLEAARAAGCVPVLVRSGHGSGIDPALAAATFDALPAAVPWILARLGA